MRRRRTRRWPRGGRPPRLSDLSRQAIEAEALETSDIIDVPLSKVKLPRGSLIGAIVRGDEIIIPGGSHEVKAGDRLIIFALQKALPKLEKLLTVKVDFF